MTRRKFYRIGMSNGEQYLTDRDLLSFENPDLKFAQFQTFQRCYYCATKEGQFPEKATTYMQPKSTVWLNTAHIVSVEAVGYAEVKE